MSNDSNSWNPLRPNENDLQRITNDVKEISQLQTNICKSHVNLKCPDRVAHQYQIAGGKVFLNIADSLPEELNNLGLFKLKAEYIGIGRISTGLGTPHVESVPDFLGLMTAFQTAEGNRIDFLGINHPVAPADDHKKFIDVLHATSEAAGEEIPLIGDWGDYDLGNFLAEQKAFGLALIKRQGLIDAGKSIKHIIEQTLKTFHSSTAYQDYWTGIVEAKSTAGKFLFKPIIEVNQKPGLHPGETHFSQDWRNRQTATNIIFNLYWIPFINQQKTSTTHMIQAWDEQQKTLVGKITFPKIDYESEEALHWRILAAEMGANPGNWIADEDNTISQPATEFTLARKLAYKLSQQGRNALPEHFYQEVFNSGNLSDQLKQELMRRLNEKPPGEHVRWAD